MEALIEFGKILIPASLVLYAVYLTVRSFIAKEIELKKLEIRTRSIDTVHQKNRNTIKRCRKPRLYALTGCGGFAGSQKRGQPSGV